MLLRVDPSDPTPLWAQIVTAVTLEVENGDLAPGDRLPAARELAGALEINVHTVLQAYARLRDDGVIELRRRHGAVIRPAGAGVADAAAAFVKRARAAGLSEAAIRRLVDDALR